MATQYASVDVDLLSEIRDDILNRPSAYRAGENFLREQYGPERLRRDTLGDWEQLKDHPTEKESNRALADKMTRVIADPAERETRHREILEQASGPPNPEQWTPAACACRAIQGLRNAMNGEHHDAKAQAVLLLAVMLWDANADKRHSIFTAFGAWGTTPAGEINSISRWAATSCLDEQSDLRRWMETVRMAWKALPKPTVEAVENLIRWARAYLTDLEGGRDLSFGLEKRVNEAATQAGFSPPFSRSEGTGENARSIYVAHNNSVGEEAGCFRIVNPLGKPLALLDKYRQAMSITLRNLILEAEERAAKLRAVGKRIEQADAKPARPTPTTDPQAKGTVNRRKRRLARERKPTTKQLEALKVVGECSQNFAEAGRRLKLDPKTVRERYEAGIRNAGKLVSKLIGKPSTQSIQGKRGETIVAADDDGPAAIGPRPVVQRDRR
jgi:hypothetical protein